MSNTSNKRREIKKQELSSTVNRFWCVFTGIDELLSFEDAVEKCLELHRVHISFFLFFIKCELMEFFDNFIFSTAIDLVPGNDRSISFCDQVPPSFLKAV